MKAASPFENFKELASLVVNMTKNEDNNLIEVRMGAKIIGLDDELIELNQESLNECLYLCDYITGIKLDIPWNRDACLSEKDKNSTDNNIICKRVSADFFNVEQKIAVGIEMPGVGAFDTSINGTNTLNGPGGASGGTFKQPRYVSITSEQTVDKNSDINNQIGSERTNVSYESQTYYLKNLESSVGDIGGVTANADAVCIFTVNNKHVYFSFNSQQHPYLTLFRVGEDFLMYNMAETVFRIGSKSGLHLWGDGKYELSGAPNLAIDPNGNIGVNVKSPSAKFHVNGSAMFEDHVNINGDVHVTNSTFHITWEGSGISKTFYIQEGVNKDRAWLGTKSNHLLTIATNSEGQVNFMPGKYAVFYKKSNALNPIPISEANKAKYALFVEGGILSEDYSLGPISSWADHVFSKDYNLKPLSEVASFINANNRLPDIPSKSEINEDGYSLHEMNVKFLQKIEELTLYTIQQDKEISELKGLVKSYESIVDRLEKLERI